LLLLRGEVQSGVVWFEAGPLPRRQQGVGLPARYCRRRCRRRHSPLPTCPPACCRAAASVGIQELMGARQLGEDQQLVLDSVKSYYGEVGRAASSRGATQNFLAQSNVWRWAGRGMSPASRC
jgi:hypothetical protein